MVLLEVCCTSLDSALAMLRAGAHRLEICSDLSCGGLTPAWLSLLHPATFPSTPQHTGTVPPYQQHTRTYQPIQQPTLQHIGTFPPDQQHTGISLEEFLERTHVLIRCRPGNFCFSHAEVGTMCESIRLCRQIGVRGVVIGALTSEGDPDLPALHLMINAATAPGPGPATASAIGTATATCTSPRPLTLVFHRAFDECRDPLGTLEQIINLGFSTILTSGQAPNAEAGIPMLSQLVDKAAGRITIMAGKGVTVDNVTKIIRQTGVPAVHLSERPGIPEVLLRTFHSSC
jgi:copper homeostasis protein